MPRQNHIRTEQAAAEFAARVAGAAPYRPTFDELGKGKKKRRVRRVAGYEAIGIVPKGTAAALRERMASPPPRPPRSKTNLKARGARPTVVAVGDARFPAGIKGGPPGGTDAFMRALLQLCFVVVVFINERFSSSVRSG